MGATGVPLGIWNQAVPSLIISVAAGHSAQMLKRWSEEIEAGEGTERAVIETMTHVGPVMLAAGGTATLGFASLALLRVPGMADLGLAAAYGIGSAVALELTFVPALRRRLRPPRHTRSAPARAGALEWLGTQVRSGRGRVVLLGAAAVVLAWSALGLTRVRTGGAPHEYLPADHPVARDLEAIRAHFPGTVTMTILFSGPPGSIATPEMLAAIDRLQRALAAHPDVTRAMSLVDLVEELHATLTPERTRRLPADRALLAQLLFLGRGAAFERFVDQANARSVLWVYLRSDDSEDIRRVLALARREAAGLELPEGVQVAVAGGAGPMLVALGDRVTHGKVINIAALLAVIFLLSALVLRSPVAGAFVLVPL